VRKILARLAVPVLLVSLAPLIAIATAKPAAAAGPCGTVSTAPAYTHVIWIWMENHSYGDIIGNTSQAPYINTVAGECGLATNYYNLSHPSLPNYVGATSGLAVSSLTPFVPDCNPTGSCVTSAASIFGQGESWKAYEESMPSNCLGTNSGEYAVRHNPPPYFTSLNGCSTFDVPYAQLATDLANNTLPAFSFVTPNLIDDMHDGTINQGDMWLSSNLPTILNSSAYPAAPRLSSSPGMRAPGAAAARTASATSPTPAATWPPSWSARARRPAFSRPPRSATIRCWAPPSSCSDSRSSARPPAPRR
jgi:hypothetical protein